MAQSGVMPAKYAHCVPRYPVRHRSKIPFGPTITVPLDFSDRALRLRRLDAELDRFILSAQDYRDLLGEAFASNIHYSTKIEGNPLTLEEVRRLTRNSLEGIPPPSRLSSPRQEILNHLSVWLDPKSFRRPWSVPFINSVHQFLLSEVEPDASPGSFRTTRAPITQNGRDIVFAPAEPASIELELDSLLRWVNESSAAYFPVASASVLFHEFESIHPFRDGNGRTGRTLFHAYLQTGGLPNAKLCMIEKHLAGNPEVYYTLLSWTDQAGQYLEFLDFAMDAVIRAYEEAEALLRAKDLLSSDLDETAKRLLQKAKRHEAWFKVADASSWTDNRGDATIRKYLNELVARGALEAEGQTKARRYRFAHPFSATQQTRLWSSHAPAEND